MACALLSDRNKVDQYLITILEYGNHLFDFIRRYNAFRLGGNCKTLFFPSSLTVISSQQESLVSNLLIL